MRRKLGIILMIAATTLAGTSEAARQFENFKATFTELAQFGSQPDFLAFAAADNSLPAHGSTVRGRAESDIRGGLVAASCSVTAPAEAKKTTAPKSREAARRAETALPARRADLDAA
ncbi:MAG: hypothetical protein ACRD9R_24315, partial [Pyrinomonadaceae bacterium]